MWDCLLFCGACLAAHLALPREEWEEMLKKFEEKIEELRQFYGRLLHDKNVSDCRLHPLQKHGKYFRKTIKCSGFKLGNIDQRAAGKSVFPLVPSRAE